MSAEEEKAVPAPAPFSDLNWIDSLTHEALSKLVMATSLLDDGLHNDLTNEEIRRVLALLRVARVNIRAARRNHLRAMLKREPH